MRIDRPLVYERIMGVLGDRVRAAHQLMIELGDVLPERMPRDRPLSAEEVDELAWRVYCLTNAMRLSFVRCHPTVVRLAAEWWSAGPETAQAYEAFCMAHWN